MRAGWRAVGSPSTEARIADAAHGGGLLQLGDVPRFHQGPLADALSRSHARVCPAAGNAGHDRGPARGRRAAGGRAQLRHPYGEVHVEAARRMGLDGLSDPQGGRRASVTRHSDVGRGLTWALYPLSTPDREFTISHR